MGVGSQWLPSTIHHAVKPVMTSAVLRTTMTWILPCLPPPSTMAGALWRPSSPSLIPLHPWFSLLGVLLALSQVPSQVATWPGYAKGDWGTRGRRCWSLWHVPAGYRSHRSYKLGEWGGGWACIHQALPRHRRPSTGWPRSQMRMELAEEPFSHVLLHQPHHEG